MEASKKYADIFRTWTAIWWFKLTAFDSNEVNLPPRRRDRRGMHIASYARDDKAETNLGALRVSERLACLLLRLIDLRLLERVGVIHIDRLPLGVKVNRADAALAMAVAGGLRAAEREVNFGADGRSIDVSDAGLQIADCRKRLVHILRVQRRR